MRTNSMFRQISGILTFCAVLILFSSCQFTSGEVTKGSGKMISKAHTVTFFDAIDLSGAYNVALSKGSTPGVSIETDDNLHELIVIETRDGVLSITSDRESILRPSRMDLFIVYTDDIKKITVSGACKLTSSEKLVSDQLFFNLSGASDLHLEVETESLMTKVSGAGNIHLFGTASRHRIELSGASNLNAKDLLTQETQISLSGAGSADVYASESLDASLSGVGKIQYHGDPKDKQINKSGLGSIRSAN